MTKKTPIFLPLRPGIFLTFNFNFGTVGQMNLTMYTCRQAEEEPRPANYCCVKCAASCNIQEIFKKLLSWLLSSVFHESRLLVFLSPDRKLKKLDLNSLHEFLHVHSRDAACCGFGGFNELLVGILYTKMTILFHPKL